MSCEPKTLACNCNWRSYAAANLAGTLRMQYPANLRIVRVMCSGMVYLDLVIQAFNKGANGVYGHGLTHRRPLPGR